MIVLTIDLESWDKAWSRKCSIDLTLQHLDVLNEVIHVLEKSDKKVTFFTTLEFAERFPDEVRDMAKKHEIASHSATHRIFRKHIQRDEFAKEVSESKKGLERLVGRIYGFRAPAFMIPPELPQILKNAGYLYDSSVMPSTHIPGWYGYKAPREPYLADYNNIFKKSKNGFPEFPLAVTPLVNIPVGGFFLRLMGSNLSRKFLTLCSQKHKVAVTYLHLYDLMDLPRVKGIPRRVYIRSGRKNLRIFRELVEVADNVTLSQLMGVCDGNSEV